jgi:hypothetical protein
LAIFIVSKRHVNQGKGLLSRFITIPPNGISCGGSRSLLNTWSGISSFVPNERKRKPKGDMQGTTRHAGSAKRLDTRVHVRLASITGLFRFNSILGAANRIFPGGKSVALIFYRNCFSWGPALKFPGLTTFEGYNQPETGNDILDYSLSLDSRAVTPRYLILRVD